MRHAIVAPLILLAACGPSPAEDAADAGRAEQAESFVPTPVETPEQSAPPPAAPQTTDADAGTCAAQIGEAAAQELVDRCIAVSPATRPPCNAQNSCEMIQGEIDRACTLFADDPPAECAAG